jgi:hypothetical protein
VEKLDISENRKVVTCAGAKQIIEFELKVGIMTYNILNCGPTVFELFWDVVGAQRSHGNKWPPCLDMLKWYLWT